MYSTVTTDMDIEMQEAMMLANQLFAAVLVSNEIKLVLNTRCGVRETQQRFSNIPSNVMCASGFLGCQNATDFFTASVYVDKILKSYCTIDGTPSRDNKKTHMKIMKREEM